MSQTNNPSNPAGEQNAGANPKPEETVKNEFEDTASDVLSGSGLPFPMAPKDDAPGAGKPDAEAESPPREGDAEPRQKRTAPPSPRRKKAPSPSTTWRPNSKTSTP